MEAAFRRAVLAQELGFDAEGYTLRRSRKHHRTASSSGPMFERLRALHLGDFRPPTRMDTLRERFNLGIADAYAREKLLREIAREETETRASTSLPYDEIVRRQYADAARRKGRSR